MFASHLIGRVAKHDLRRAVFQDTHARRIGLADHDGIVAATRPMRPTTGAIASFRVALLACTLTLALVTYDPGIAKDGPIVDLFDVVETTPVEIVLAEPEPSGPVSDS